MSGEAQPDATINPEQALVGTQTIPDLGVVAAPLGDDPNFPAACVFTFDVATSADVGLAYLFSIGSLFADDAVYIPVPAIAHGIVERRWRSCHSREPCRPPHHTSTDRLGLWHR